MLTALIDLSFSMSKVNSWQMMGGATLVVVGIVLVSTSTTT